MNETNIQNKTDRNNTENSKKEKNILNSIVL